MVFSDDDLFEQGPVTCFTWRLTDGWPVLEVTSSVKQFGYAPEEFLSGELLFAAIVHPDDLSRLAEEVSKYKEKQIASFQQDYRIITKSGEVRWVYDKTIIKYHNDDGQIYAKGYLLDITERKQIEQELHESTQQYYQLFESNKAIELLIDPETRNILKANKAAERYYGYSEIEFMQMRISDINIMTSEQIEHEMALALTQQRDYFNFKHRLKTGELRDVCVYSGPIVKGNRTVLYSIVHDITEQRLAEAALMQSESRFRTIIESTSEGFLELTPQLRIKSVNSAFEKLTGYGFIELKGRCVLNLLSESSRRLLRKQMRSTTEQHLAAEIVFRHKAGHHVYVRYKATNVGNDMGRFAFVTDISERKRNELQLKKLSGAVKQSASSIMITDKTGIIEYVNPHFCEVTGYQESDIVGQTPSILSTKNTPPETHKRLWKTILAGKDWHGETHNRAKSGEYYWSRMSISPITDEEGEISHFISVSEDITEYKAKQIQMEKLALSDPLTGLANRRLFDAQLTQSLEIVRRKQQDGIGVIMVDLDYFKAINDTHGHDIGDSLLKEVAQRLRQCTRKEDTIARFGGDEFAVILQEVNKVNDAACVARKILNALSQPILIGKLKLTISCSIGVSTAPIDSLSPNELIKCADIALYKSKNNGRNQIYLSHP